MKKRILLCLDRDQFEKFDYSLPFNQARASIGGNSGNNVFQMSLQKLLTNPENDVTIDTVFLHSGRIPQERFDEINANYDCLVFSPANVLATYAKKHALTLWKNNISKIKIPVYAIGMGAQSDRFFSKEYLSGIKTEACELVKAISKTGGWIGTRGYFTSDCLTTLGFKENEDFMTIGCPSMYMKGPDLKIQKKNLTPDTFAPLVNGFRAFNSNEFFNNFIKYPKSIFVCQEEFYKLLFKQDELTWKEYQYLLDKNEKFMRLYKDDRVKIYCTFQSWYHDILDRGLNFAYGCRIHGNVVPLLAGVPVYIDTFDSRVLELSQYFDIPNGYVENQNFDLFDLYNSVDYTEFNNNFKAKYERFEGFMNSCGLHIDPKAQEIKRIDKAPVADYQNLLKKKNEVKNIVFVAHEFGLYPGHGGIASYLYNITSWLLENTPHRIHVLASCYDDKCDLLENKMFSIVPIGGDLFQQRQQVYQYCKSLDPDYIEFAEYNALGLRCIEARIENNEFKNTVFVTNNHSATRECWSWSNERDFTFAPFYLKPTFVEESTQIENSDYCFAPSTFLAKYVKEHYHLKNDVLVFANPYFKKLKMKNELYKEVSKEVDLEEYKDSFNIVLITRFEGRKHQDRLIEAVSELVKEGYNIKCFLAGNTCGLNENVPDYRLHLYEQLSEEEKKNIYFFDFLNLKQQEKFMAIADLAVMPSTYENQPVAMVETVLRGVPVMASCTSGITDYTKNDALLFDPTIKNDLKDKLRLYIEKTAEEREKIRFAQFDNLHHFLNPSQCILKRFDLKKVN